MGAGEYFRIIRERRLERRFHSLFLFVTSRCNSLCRTCFYFDQLNSPDDLTFDQIARLSATAPPFRKLWISGGEPVMREELAEIVEMFVERNGVRNLNLPTNGLLPKKIFRTIDHLLGRCPDLSIDLNFSLDGLANTHDAIRRVPNNFRTTLATIEEAERRYEGRPRLRRNVATVITRENYQELVELGRRLLEGGDLDGQYFEIIRGYAPDGTLKAVPLEELRALHRRLMPLHRRYAAELFAHLPWGIRQFATVYYLGNIRLHYELHEECLERPRPWPMPCTAGETSIVIDHNGVFRACELRGIVGRLQDYNFDVSTALRSPAMSAEVADIPRAGCWCTHSCFIQDSSKFSPRVQLFHIPWMFVRQLLEGGSLEALEPYRALEIPG
ncbi:MAG: radical SAM protein [Acidobacteria bacterium]|nr:radical SAM protein [Acidobacteriota bacterium]